MKGAGGVPNMVAVKLKIRPIHGLIVVFVILSLYYSVTTPLFEAPDEPAHFDYALYLARGRGLPIQSFEHDKVVVVQGHHPPLYYALGALLTFWIDMRNAPDVYRANPNSALRYRGSGQEPNFLLHTAAEQFPFRGYALAVHLFRALSVVFGAVTMWGVYRLGQIVTRQEIVALGAAALVAFNPQFLYVSGMINNDNAVTTFLTLALVVMAVILVDGPTRKRAIWLGIWIGLGLLSKATALAWGVLVVYLLVVLLWREREWRPIARLMLTMAVPVLLISGWWFVRNQVLYGDPMGYRMFLSNTSSIFAPVDFTILGTWRAFAEQTHQSFWGNFGWLVSPIRQPWPTLLAGLYLLAMVGAVLGWVWRRETGQWRGLQRKSAWGLLLLVMVVIIAWTINFARTNGSSGFQGRYLFPAVGAIAVLIVSGVSCITPDRWRGIPIGLVIVPLFGLAVSAPGQYITSVYRYLTMPESALNTVPHRLDGTFSPEIALAGYEVQLHPVSTLVTLYWKAQGMPTADYKVFIHAVNDQGQLCGQQDALTQGGVFPMTFWRAGDVIEDQHRVPIDPECCGAEGCRLQVGLYREDTGERLLYSLNGQPVSDHVEIRP
jgi:4-amino-4-deoxy-L-arabinose transferase-like glycosyltransferase